MGHVNEAADGNNDELKGLSPFQKSQKVGTIADYFRDGLKFLTQDRKLTPEEKRLQSLRKSAFQKLKDLRDKLDPYTSQESGDLNQFSYQPYEDFYKALRNCLADDEETWTLFHQYLDRMEESIFCDAHLILSILEKFSGDPIKLKACLRLFASGYSIVCGQLLVHEDLYKNDLEKFSAVMNGFLSLSIRRKLYFVNKPFFKENITSVERFKIFLDCINWMEDLDEKIILNEIRKREGGTGASSGHIYR